MRQTLVWFDIKDGDFRHCFDDDIFSDEGLFSLGARVRRLVHGRTKGGDEQEAARDLTSQDSDGTDLSCCAGEDGRVNVDYTIKKASIEEPERSGIPRSYISGVEVAQGSAWVAEQELAL